MKIYNDEHPYGIEVFERPRNTSPFAVVWLLASLAAAGTVALVWWGLA